MEQDVRLQNALDRFANPKHEANKANLDRVQNHSSPAANLRIQERIRENILNYGRQDPAAIQKRLETLDREWDIERFLEVNASALAFSGLILSLLKNKKFLWIPAIVLPFLLQHGLQGWCPPLPLLRKLGVRTRGEIDQEKYALKALRGDFKGITPE